MLCSSLGIGGAERHWSLLVPGLRELGFDPTVVTLRAGGPFMEELRRGGVTTHFVAMRTRIDPLGLLRAVRLASPRPDAVVTHSANAQVVGHLLSRKARVPHVTIEQRGPELPRRRHHRAALRLVAPRVDAVVAVTRSQIPELVRVGYREERIRVIANAARDFRPRGPREERRSRLGVSAGDFLAVLPATLRRIKNADGFVRAVLAANREEPRIKGLVVGGGPELRSIGELASTTGGVVRTLGPREDVEEILEAADAVCLTSLAEGLPMVVLEAMSLARPVIATAVGGIPEALGEEAGVLVQPGDEPAFARALVRLARDPSAARFMGLRGKARHEKHFTVDLMVEAYADLLTEVIARGTGR